MARTKALEAATRETFMTLLRRHRIARGKSQTWIAEKLGIKPSNVSQWESGSKMPGPKHIPKLAKLLGVDAMTLTLILEPEHANSGSGR